MHANSLRHRLLKQLLWPLILILLMGAVFAYQFALRASSDANDLGLLDDALDLAKQVEVYQGKMTLKLPLAAQQMLLANNDDHVTYAAWDETGHLFSGDPRLLKLRMPRDDENHLFQNLILGDEESRDVVLRANANGKTMFIAVSQTTHGRNQLSDKIFLGLLLPEALLALISIIAILFGVRRGLSPVELLRDEIGNRSPHDLRSIDEAHAPLELRPIVHVINDLFTKLTTTFASHRRFIADAAHQLRTPLAALRSQIEVGLEQHPEDTKVLLQKLLATTQRTSHLANQLLSLARLEHTEQQLHEKALLDLQDVVREATVDFVAPAAQKKIDLNFLIAPSHVHGNSLLLRELVANLLDNAIRYTAIGGHIVVRLQTESDCCVLMVEDDGPGVPEAELENLGKPFHTLATSRSDGCGLGLAIVLEIARIHGAKVIFGHGQDNHGLSVRVEFHRNQAVKIHS
jgi:two-component system sensor histidine kinase TctE